MCLIAFGLRVHPRYPLVLLGNRDEFHDRPARAMHWWRSPRLLAGRDLRAGGSWLALDAGGRLATVTNFREPETRRPDARSRGQLVIDALVDGADSLAGRLLAEAPAYNGFNLLWGNADRFRYASHLAEAPPRLLDAGVYGLSNGLLDTPWPKLLRAREALRRELSGGGEPEVETLFGVLLDTRVPADEVLPDTGIGLDWERLLAPAFIRNPRYGTRSSTLVLVRHDGEILCEERCWTPEGSLAGRRRYRFTAAGR